MNDSLGKEICERQKEPIRKWTKDISMADIKRTQMANKLMEGAPLHQQSGKEKSKQIPDNFHP